MAKYKGCDVRKFIIAEDGEMRFGGFFDYHPYFHKELFYNGEKTCNGGGYCYIIPEEKTILMYGISADYGKPDFSKFTIFEGESDWKFVYRASMDKLDDDTEIIIDTSNVDFWD